MGMVHNGCFVLDKMDIQKSAPCSLNCPVRAFTKYVPVELIPSSCDCAATKIECQLHWSLALGAPHEMCLGIFPSKSSSI